MASERSKKVAKERAALKTQQPPAKRKPAPKAVKVAPPTPDPVPEVTPSPKAEAVDYSSMTKSQLQELLKERGITYLPQSTKRILLGLLENA